jgi:dihydroorotate dehydrogenase (NAD+) catalytic subunit
MVADPKMSVPLGPITLKNPVMAASGTFGYGREFADFVDPSALGAVVAKGISLKPRAGNPPPRIVETPSGMLNAIGLENVGLDAFVRDKLPWLVERKATVIANIMGETVEEYALIAKGLDRAGGVAMIELNVSCPNVAAGGLIFGTDDRATAAVVRAVKDVTDLPIMVKLTPLVSDVARVAQAAVAAGACALSLINTIPGMAVDLESGKPKLANIVGGLSGPAIKPVALRLVWLAAKAVDVPIVGIGGIMSAEDALEFILVGASAVQIGTGNFINPRLCIDVIDGIGAYIERKNLAGIEDLRGRLTTR